jgi:hypothetical protein
MVKSWQRIPFLQADHNLWHYWLICRSLLPKTGLCWAWQSLYHILSQPLTFTGGDGTSRVLETRHPNIPLISELQSSELSLPNDPFNSEFTDFGTSKAHWTCVKSPLIQSTPSNQCQFRQWKKKYQVQQSLCKIEWWVRQMARLIFFSSDRTRLIESAKATCQFDWGMHEGFALTFQKVPGTSTGNQFLVFCQKKRRSGAWRRSKVPRFLRS